MILYIQLLILLLLLTCQLLASLATDSIAKVVKFLEINGLTREMLASLAPHSFGR